MLCSIGPKIAQHCGKGINRLLKLRRNPRTGKMEYFAVNFPFISVIISLTLEQLTLWIRGGQCRRGSRLSQSVMPVNINKQLTYRNHK